MSSANSALGTPEQLRDPNYTPPLASAVPLGIQHVLAMFVSTVTPAINMLSDVNWNRRNMVIFAISLSVGLGLQLVPDALQHLPGTAKVLLTSGLLPAAFLAIVLNLVLPDELPEDLADDEPTHWNH